MVSRCPPPPPPRTHPSSAAPNSLSLAPSPCSQIPPLHLPAPSSPGAPPAPFLLPRRPGPGPPVGPAAPIRAAARPLTPSWALRGPAR